MKITKETIMDAAMSIFSTKGFHATSVQEITTACGIAKGSFYTHFASKEQLILALLNRMMNELNHQLTAATHLSDKIACILSFSLQHKAFIRLQSGDPTLRSIPEIEQMMIAYHLKMMKWQCEQLVNHYGEKIERHVWDCSALLSGMIKEYLFYAIYDDQKIDVGNIPSFLMKRLDSIVEGFTKEDVPLLTERYFGVSSQKGWEKTMDAIKQCIVISELPETSKRHGLSSVDQLMHEWDPANPEPKAFLIEALLVYLRSKRIPGVEELLMDIEKEKDK